MLTQAVRGRIRLTPAERTANALDLVLGGVPGGLTERRRDRRCCGWCRAPGPATEAAMAQLLDAVPRREPPPVRFWQRCGGPRPAGSPPGWPRRRWLVWPVVVYLVVEPVVTVVAVLLDGVTGELNQQREWGAVLGTSVSALITAVLSVRAALRLRRDRADAFRLFKLALLVDLLFGQIFNFTVNQFGAVSALAVDLFLLGVVTAEHHRLRRAESPLAG